MVGSDCDVKRFLFRFDWHVIIAFAAACGAWSASGCDDDEPELPPDDDPAVRPVEPDLANFASIKADRSFTVANLVFVLQPDRTQGGLMGVTLASSRPAADGSRMAFGTFEKAESLEALARTTIDFGGVAIYDLRGNGIFTPLGAYQPKLATLRITAHDDARVSGTIRGEFYDFKPGQTTLRPPVISLEVSFAARLIVK